MNPNLIVKEIEKESEKLKYFTLDKLKNDIIKLSNQKNNKNVDSFLIQWFSLIREISHQTLGLRHYNTQLLAGIFLHYGKIVEMNTGEGKTLVSTLPVSLNALTKKGAHVITVNEYLAERDKKWMEKLYSEIGLSIGLIKNNQTIKKKKENYSKDITYITNSELVFDYLRDNSTYRLSQIIQPKLNYCLVDEIDSIFIDEARTPLIISLEENLVEKKKLYISAYIANTLKITIDFLINEKRKDISLTEKGAKTIEDLLETFNIYDFNNPWISEILNALKAKYFYKRDIDYVILNKKIAIIDEFTGRILPDRRWSLGLHEAIEAKENLNLSSISKTQSSMTYQSFFPLYFKYSGMTGTALTSKDEFKLIYDLEVIKVSPNKPSQRKDFPDKLFISETLKWKAIVSKIMECNHKGQPILVGTYSIENSDYLSTLLNSLNIKHKVLNAKPENAKKESEIIAQAGRFNSITIATNMAGRGTDIILGGNLPLLIKQRINLEIFNFLNQIIETSYENFIKKILEEYNYNLLKLKKDILNLPYFLSDCLNSLQNFYNYLYEISYKNWVEENKKVKSVGGLYILGTERSENRRIDAQLIGRSGRQGDIGKSEFFLSLDDPLLKIFGGDKLKSILKLYSTNYNLPITSPLVTQSIIQSQQKIENYYFSIRENLFAFEYIINLHRRIFYTNRRSILCLINFEIFLYQFIDCLYKLDNFQNFKKYYSSKKYIKKIRYFKKIQSFALNWCILEINIKEYFYYQRSFFKNIYSFAFLQIVDFFWVEYLESTNFIKDSIKWSSYGQENPLEQYTAQTEKYFSFLFKEIIVSMLYYILYKSSYTKITFS